MAEENAISFHTKVAADFDRQYAHNNSFLERYAVWTEIINKYSSKHFRVLDVGCGPGIFSFYLSERNECVVGIDASPEMIKMCQEKQKKLGVKNTEFLICNIDSLPSVLTKKYNMIICSSVLEYLDDLQESLKLISTFLTQDGLFIFSMPNKLSIYRNILPIIYRIVRRPKYYRYVKNICTLKKAEVLLNTLGLKILESDYFAKTPFLSMVFRRIGFSRYSDNLFIIVSHL